MAGGEVTNLDGYKTDVLCNHNIYNKAYNINPRWQNDVEDTSLVRFYSITKDTDIYNSWFEDGHNNDSTGTLYHY